MLVPRIFVHYEVAKIELIALSISPLVGLFLQAVWLTNISKLRVYNRKEYMKFAFYSVLICLLIFGTWPIWDWFIIKVYLIDDSIDLLRFKLTIVASIVFFLGANIINLLKITNQKFEIYAYILSILSYVLLVSIGLEMYESMIISAVILLMFSFIGLYKYEKNTFYKE